MHYKGDLSREVLTLGSLVEKQRFGDLSSLKNGGGRLRELKVQVSYGCQGPDRSDPPQA